MWGRPCDCQCGEFSRPIAPARQAGDPAIEFEIDERGCDLTRRDGEVADQLVLGEGGRPQPGENEVVELCHLAQRAGRRRGRGRCGDEWQFGGAGVGARRGRSQRLDHVLGRADEDRAVPDQHVAPGGAGVEGMAGDREHFTVVVERVPRGQQTARLRRRLDHDHGLCQSGDDPVAGGEMAGLWLQADRCLADPKTLRADPVGQRRVLGRVDDVDAAGLHGDGCRKRRVMRGGVDASGEARDHGEPGLAQGRGKPLGHARSEGRGVACTHQRHRRAAEQRGVADAPQKRRRIGEIRECGGPVRIVFADQAGPGGASRLQFMFDHAGRAGGVVGHTGLPRDLWQRTERGLCRAVFRDQPSVGRRPHPA